MTIQNHGPRDRTASVPTTPQHVPEPVDLSEESVAGEEDPGASMDEGEPSPFMPQIPDPKRPK